MLFEESDAYTVLVEACSAMRVGVVTSPCPAWLLTLDGRWTDTVADTYTAAGFVKPGKAVKVGIKRGDKEMEVTVKPVAGI